MSYIHIQRTDVWRGRELTRVEVTSDDSPRFEYINFGKTWGPGRFTIQQHAPGSMIRAV